MSLLRRQEPCGDVTGAHDCRAFWRDVAPGAPNPKVAAGRRSNRSLLNSSPYDTHHSSEQRGAFSNALNFCRSAIAVLVRSPCLLPAPCLRCVKVGDGSEVGFAVRSKRKSPAHRGAQFKEPRVGLSRLLKSNCWCCRDGRMMSGRTKVSLLGACAQILLNGRYRNSGRVDRSSLHLPAKP